MSLPSQGDESTGARGAQTRGLEHGRIVSTCCPGGAGQGRKVLKCFCGGDEISNAFICSALNPGSTFSISTVGLPGVAKSASLFLSDVENGQKKFRCGSIIAMDAGATLLGFHSYATPSMIFASQSQLFPLQSAIL